MKKTKFLGGIDIGSNTIKLLMMRIEDGQVAWRTEHIRTTRLGALDDKHNINPISFARSLEVIDEFEKMARLVGAEICRIIATSAVRDAVNSSDFVGAIGKIISVPVEILSGEEEARYSYQGAKRLTAFSIGTPVIDVGGASTEVISENSDGKVNGVSANVGAVRMIKNGWDKETMKEQLAASLHNIDVGNTVVGVGGTITTLAGLIAGIKKFEQDTLEGMIIKKNQLDKLLEKILPLTIKERCEFSPLLSKRGEVIEQGLLIWISLMEILELKKIIISTGGVLDGAIADML